MKVELEKSKVTPSEKVMFDYKNLWLLFLSQWTLCEGIPHVKPK